MLPTVSVIIPAKNEEKTISKCLDSILASDYPKLDVIVAVDGCTDKTIEIAKSYRKVRTIKLKQQGCKAAALNRVLKHTKGSIIGIYDADCIVEPDCISKAVKSFEDEKISGVSGTVLSGNKDSFVSRALSLETSMISFFQHFFSKNGRDSLFMGKNMFIRKKVLLEIGFDEYSFSEDAALSLQMMDRNHKIHFEPNAVTYHEEPSTFASFINQRKRWCRGALRIMRARKYTGFKGFINDAQRGIYFYIAPFGTIVAVLYLLFTFLNMQILAIPFIALWVLCVSVMVYSKLFFKESLKDFVSFPLWFVLSNIQLPIMIYSAYKEFSGSEMKWYKAERK